MRFGWGVMGVLMGAGAALADVPPAETAEIGEARVTVYAMSFLSEEEVATLRLVLTSPEALALFVPAGGGHAALAVSPADGFIREGGLVKSASAIAGMETADKAAEAALTACDGARQGKEPCVVVLEVAPK
jgi:hypothetical protein